MQLVELGQQSGVLARVVARKARHRALTPPQLAGIAVLAYQPGHRLARIAADPFQVAQYHTPLRPPERTIFEPPEGLLNPAVALVLALDGELHLRGPCQEATDVLQALNLLVVHISHHG